MQIELAGLVVILAVVGVLTDLRPGSEAPPAPKPVLHGAAGAEGYSRGAPVAASGLASTLSLVTDELEEARRILERGQAARVTIGAARLGQSAPCRDRSCGTDDAAERERAQPAGATVVVHATILRCG